MAKLTKPQTWREYFSEMTFPQLYSKRGFEKNRIKWIIPPDRTELAYIKDKNGIKLTINV